MPPHTDTPALHVRNADYSDREMLGNIAAACRGSSDGWASTTEIAIEMGYVDNPNGASPATKIASRLSWMRRGELLESAPPDREAPYREHGDQDTRWRLTARGEVILNGRLSKAVERAVEQMDAGAHILMMREVTRRAWVEGDVATAFAVRREFQHNLAKRKLPLR